MRYRIYKLWFDLLLKLRIQRLEFSTEQCPAELLTQEDDGTMVVNLVVEPKWFWQKRAPIPKLDCCEPK